MANRKLRATPRPDAWQGANTARSWTHSATKRSLWDGNETSRPSNGNGGQRAAFLNLRRLRPIIQRNAPEIRRSAADVREWSLRRSRPPRSSVGRSQTHTMSTANCNSAVSKNTCQQCGDRIPQGVAFCDANCKSYFNQAQDRIKQEIKLIHNEIRLKLKAVEALRELQFSFEDWRWIDATVRLEQEAHDLWRSTGAADLPTFDLMCWLNQD